MQNYRAVFERTKNYILNNLDGELSACDLASREGYSEYHFSRLFKKQEGISIMSYVRNERLKKADEEIRKGTKISELYYRYGFETESGFMRAYKKYLLRISA